MSGGMSQTTLRLYDACGMVDGLSLRSLIDLFRPFAPRARWRISDVIDGDHRRFEATGETGDALETLAEHDEILSLDALTDLAERAGQIIWGRFDSLIDGGSEAWLTLRAIDSTFVEITTADQDVLRLIDERFSDVRAYAELWQSPWNR